ncbi:MAG: homoserine kinase, partial [Halanaerobiales bacterium]
NTFYFKRTNGSIEIKLKNTYNNDDIDLPLSDNLLYLAMRTLFNKLEKKLKGVLIEKKVGIPFSRGLGSSATAILAGLQGANILLDYPFDDEQILDMAIEIEGHPDNVIPAWKGGFVINVITGGKCIFKKFDINNDIKFVVAIPDFELSTEKLRRVLPDKTDYKNAVFNHSRTALLTASLYDGDLEKLAVAMEDKLHQDYRADLIPGYQEVVRAAYQAGAAGVALSGAGPTVIAITRNDTTRIGHDMVKKFTQYNINSEYRVLQSDNRGLQVIEDTDYFNK